MRPIRTRLTNHVYHGPTLDIADLPCRRVRRGHIASYWQFSAEERTAIAAGANLMLQVYTEPIPPVGLAVVEPQDEVGGRFLHPQGACSTCDRLGNGG